MTRTAYWVFVGALMGIGLIAFSLALLPFLLGAILALYGLKRFGPKQFWLALFTMGLVPALILAFDYFAADPETTWVPASYLYLTLFFGIIALVGLHSGCSKNGAPQLAQIYL